MADEKTFTQDDIDAAVEAATAKFTDSIAKLEAKNAEIVADLRKARKGAEIKPEDLQAAEERADKAEAALEAANKSVKQLTTERDKAVKSLEAESGFTQKLLIQDGIKSALIENGVKDPDFIDSLTAKFSGAASIKVDGDSRVALHGDKPLSDFIKEWAGSDAGKKFVEAPANGGGAAPGSNGTKGGKTMTRAQFDALGQAERSAAAKDGVKVVDA